MDYKDVFVQAIGSAEPCIARVTDADMANATPCSEWDLRRLLNHIVYELLWVPDMLDGKTVAEVGDKYDGDVLGDDPQGAWKQASQAATAAVQASAPDAVVHLSYADKSTEAYVMEIANDVLIHGWDVGRSLRCSIMFDKKLTKAIYDSVLPRSQEFAGSGLFGTPVNVPDDAPLQVRLLALEGRQADIEP